MVLILTFFNNDIFENKQDGYNLAYDEKNNSKTQVYDSYFAES